MSETSVKSSNSKTKTTKNRAFIYDMVLISISAALIAVCSWISIPLGCSWISIPLGPVPFTLQTLGILAVMLTAGGRRGTIAVLVYLALGAVGVPVFAGFKGGIASFAGPTGGFLVGFLVSALVYWLLEKLFLKKLMTTPAKTWIFGMLAFLIFEVIMYIVGVIWFMTVYAAQTGPVGLATVMGWCVIPFIIPDIVKMVVAVLIGERASKLTKF